MAFIDILKWPLVVLIIGVICIFVFKNRVTKIGPDGIQLGTRLSGKRKLNKTIGDLLSEIKTSQTIKLYQKTFEEQLKEKELNPEDQVKFLIKSHAQASAWLRFEQLHSITISSDMDVLNKLNETLISGIEKEEVDKYVEAILVTWGDSKKDWTPDRYLSPLLDSGLITIKSKQVHLTTTGKDYLVWMAENGRVKTQNY